MKTLLASVLALTLLGATGASAAVLRIGAGGVHVGIHDHHHHWHPHYARHHFYRHR